MMTPQSISTLKERAEKAVAQSDFLQTKEDFTKQDTEILKLAIKYSTDLLLELVNACEAQDNQIKQQIEENEKLKTQLVEQDVKYNEFFKKLSASFAETAKICEIISRESKKVRTK
ncbi:unnamed protein product [marine sediment metagenome]|uniref:Uncharacterized protein n=1 Tax=marine sediment metagenome TaxID=412755 RepID=X1IG88_9ZZZZ